MASMETALTEGRPLTEPEVTHWLGLLKAVIGAPNEQMLELARRRSVELADEQPPAL
ncbi:hypothetical protein [Nonomuraea sp. NPDC050310]|uniref:hypothetical protein n=1 Tax=Nonomuraea sp. NPDC050310 TaxID=3154935 RepID=UPI0033EC913B